MWIVFNGIVYFYEFIIWSLKLGKKFKECIVQNIVRQDFFVKGQLVNIWFCELKGNIGDGYIYLKDIKFNFYYIFCGYLK